LIAEPFDFTFCHRLHPPFLKFYKSDFHHDRKQKNHPDSKEQGGPPLHFKMS
jgi:hypothetical protein